jgi:F0F1-type ATP synthase assembly protein I
MSMWIAFGVSLGAAIGLLIDNLSMGLIGGLLVAIFMSAGTLISSKRRVVSRSPKSNNLRNW